MKNTIVVSTVRLFFKYLAYTIRITRVNTEQLCRRQGRAHVVIRSDSARPVMNGELELPERLLTMTTLTVPLRT